MHPHVSTLAEEPNQSVAATLLEKIKIGRARIAVLGLGYVGLPLAVEFAGHFETIGIDIDPARVKAVNDGRSYIGDVGDEKLNALVSRRSLRASADFGELSNCDCVIICVPTPLQPGNLPDISYIISATNEIVRRLRPGQLIVLESTTYPGTTDEMLLPRLSAGGKRLDEDFLLAFSPERVDPGNREFTIADIPKIVGGSSKSSAAVTAELYAKIVPFVHVVSSTRVAETAKLWENTFRAVNIALANEMALLCYHLGMQSSEVIGAAATKPFGFMPFYPGPGVGGHCIPMDPHYLSWTASKYGYFPQFIAMADQINTSMADHIVELIGDALNDEGMAMRGARILILGVAYKEDVEDLRMSPAFSIIERIRAKMGNVYYHDPFVPRLHLDEAELPPAPRRDLREDPVERRLPAVRRSEPAVSPLRRRDDPLESRLLTDEELRAADCVVVVTGHSSIDYDRVGRIARLIVDTRNVVPRITDEHAARVVTL